MEGLKIFYDTKKEGFLDVSDNSKNILGGNKFFKELASKIQADIIEKINATKEITELTIQNRRAICKIINIAHEGKLIEIDIEDIENKEEFNPIDPNELEKFYFGKCDLYKYNHNDGKYIQYANASECKNGGIRIESVKKLISMGNTLYVKTSDKNKIILKAQQDRNESLKEAFASRNKGETKHILCTLADTIMSEQRGEGLTEVTNTIDIVVDNLIKDTGMISGILEIIDKDYVTANHIINLMLFSIQYAVYKEKKENVKVRKEVVMKYALASLLHDLGKIQVPDIILKSEKQLSSEEWEIMKKHPQWSTDIIKESGILNNLPPEISDEIIKAKEQHHEKLNGSEGRGYPLGLRGDEISLLAQEIGILDALEAMTATRGYKEGFSIEKAVRFLVDDAKAGKLNKDILLDILNSLGYLEEREDGKHTKIIEMTKGLRGTDYNSGVSSICRLLVT